MVRACTVSPQLTDRAVSYVFLGGEVKAPGRYTLEGPTTVMQAIAMAGGWNIGGNVRQVVVFRRDENWCLKATKIDVRAPLYGNDPCPMNDVWLRENDLVLVPKSKNPLCDRHDQSVLHARRVRGVPDQLRVRLLAKQRHCSGAVGLIVWVPNALDVSADCGRNIGRCSIRASVCTPERPPG